MKQFTHPAYRRVSRVGLLLMLLSLLPAQPTTAADRIVYEAYMPLMSDAVSAEVMTVDSLVLGKPISAEVTEDKPAETPSAATQIEPPPPGEARIVGDPDSPKSGPGAAPAAAEGWSTIVYEDFEGDFPSRDWRVVDDTGATDGEITWDDDDFRASSGQWSAWAANGGKDGLDPAVYRYANNMRAWMIYGPFTLAEANQATLAFDYWNLSERAYDWFGWYASTDGVNFYGRRVSGDSSGWRYMNLDLTSVPGLGDLRGDNSVWIAFVFRSDGGRVDAGPFVDNVAIHQTTATTSCPDQALAEYFPNRDLSGSPVLSRCEPLSVNQNWGTSSPAASVPADNFSARWTGIVSLPAGRYTFSTTADDELRLWLDDRLLIQSLGISTETSVEVSGGLHRLRIEYVEYGGNAQVRVAWTADSACPPVNAWRGEYWSNPNLSGAPSLCRSDNAVDFNWGSGSPSAEIPIDHFSARWTRTVNFNAGTYRFHLRGDDGVRLWIDDQLVINEWRDQSTTEFMAVRTLSAGSHKLKVEYYDAILDATAKLWWEVAPNNAVVVSNRPAFDTCAVLPTPSQMAAWWANGPYYEVNVYLGGSSLGCPAYSQALNAQWVETVGNQGWNFIPTWVGPQAPCTNYASRMSYETNIAYQTGWAEADAAASAAQNLGLTRSGAGGSIIYYDMEAYDVDDAPNLSSCRAAVNAFVNGWSQRMNELGNRAGVYGAAYASHVPDWAALEHVPDDVWVAHWVAGSYNAAVTVWDVYGLDNSLWSNHQRIRQYTGSHDESYGGVTLRIDSNIVDGHVMGKNARSAATASAETIAAEAAGLPMPLLGLDLLPSGAGRLLTDRQLRRSAAGGATWRDITPADAVGKSLRAATFLDEEHGWLVWADAPDAENRSALYVGITADGGATWQTIPLTAYAPSDPNSTQTIPSLTFVDDRNGWIVFPLASGGSFSQATLLRTRDGGQSWGALPLPSAGIPSLVDADHGWLVGGMADETLYATADGGRSWQPITLPTAAARVAYHPPAFADAQTGVVPVTQIEGETGSVGFYATTDGGATWTLAASAPLSGTHAVVEAAAPNDWWVADTHSGKLHHLHLGAEGSAIATVDLLPGVTELSFAGNEQGWAAARATTCFGDKTSADTGDPFRCVWQQSVLRTADGGQTWNEVTLQP